ncbi:hypothetical protein CO678_35010 [Bradyrhizobium diazoefficiens]|uniref:Panacea domain-containing protein n=1 Tax=Bradyrhizobium diazoefficiens TaxID=1355477 RepID=UPI000BE7BBA5|nr:Panacea domain-containing protein [Bradyrhizobium diazoefficiens]PDT57090.1 hypothetical protein CO678_35010 [Bradyrhizobium diazoefficiens]
MPLGYDAKKAAQVIAFLVKEQGGKADMIKTVKLAYMSDRRFLDLYDKPILNDDLYCLDHGPIDSMTLNLIKGQGDADSRQVWDKYLTAVDPKTHVFKTVQDDIYFGALNDAEEEVLRETVSRFKNLGPFELVDWIHDHCREWSNPRGTSTFLSYADVFKALGKEDPDKSVERVERARRLFAATNVSA